MRLGLQDESLKRERRVRAGPIQLGQVHAERQVLDGDARFHLPPPPGRVTSSRKAKLSPAPNTRGVRVCQSCRPTLPRSWTAAPDVTYASFTRSLRPCAPTRRTPTQPRTRPSRYGGF